MTLKKDKRKGKKQESQAPTLPVQFIDYQYDLVNDDYGELIHRIRTEVGIETPHGIKALPPPTVDGKKQYIRLGLRVGREGPHCIVYFRATDLYMIGFQTQDGALKELKPDGPKIEMNQIFLSSAVEGNRSPPYDILPFTGNYDELERAATVARADLSIGSPVLHEIIRYLAVPLEGKSRNSKIALGILVVITLFSESIRLKNIERKMITSNGSYVKLGHILCRWTNKWSKVSTVIESGETGRNERLQALTLELDDEGGDLETVEEAKNIVGILKYSASSS